MTWLYLSIGSWLAAFVPALWYFTTVGALRPGERPCLSGGKEASIHPAGRTAETPAPR